MTRPYGSDPFAYLLPRESNGREESYLVIFQRGGFAKETTYGYGFPTKSKLGKVITAGAPSREKIARHVRRFGREGSTQVDAPGDVISLRADGLSVPEIARTLGIAERKVKAELAA